MVDKKRKFLLDIFKSNNSILESDELSEIKYFVNNLIYIQIYLETISFSEKNIVFEYNYIEIEVIDEESKNSIEDRIKKIHKIDKIDKIDNYKKIINTLDELIEKTSIIYKINKLLKIKNLLLNIMYFEDLILITEIKNSKYANSVLDKKIIDINDSIENLKFIIEKKSDKIFNLSQAIREYADITSNVMHEMHEIFLYEILYFKRELASVKHLNKLDEILEIFNKMLINHYDKPV